MNRTKQNDTIFYKIIQEDNTIQFGKTTDQRDLELSKDDFINKKKLTFGNNESKVIIYDSHSEWIEEFKKNTKK